MAIENVETRPGHFGIVFTVLGVETRWTVNDQPTLEDLFDAMADAIISMVKSPDTKEIEDFEIRVQYLGEAQWHTAEIEAEIQRLVDGPGREFAIHTPQ